MQIAAKLSEKEHLSKVEVTAAKIKQRTLEQEKMEQLQRLKQEKSETKTADSLPPVGKQSGLPSIGGRGGAFEVDKDAMRKAQAEMDKLTDFSKPQKVQDNRSMQEVMKAKREQTEA